MMKNENAPAIPTHPSTFGMKVNPGTTELETYDICRTLDDAKAAAQERDRDVVSPTPHQLFLDIDSEEQFELFEKMWEHFEKCTGYESSTYRKAKSPSGKPGRYHITVTLTRPVDTLERVLLQSLLGSDPVREILGFRRFNDGSEPAAVTVFFEEKSPF